MKEKLPLSVTEICLVESIFFFAFGGASKILNDDNYSFFIQIGWVALGAGLVSGFITLIVKLFFNVDETKVRNAAMRNRRKYPRH